MTTKKDIDKYYDEGTPPTLSYVSSSDLRTLGELSPPHPDFPGRSAGVYRNTIIIQTCDCLELGFLTYSRDGVCKSCGGLVPQHEK